MRGEGFNIFKVGCGNPDSKKESLIKQIMTTITGSNSNVGNFSKGNVSDVDDSTPFDLSTAGDYLPEDIVKSNKEFYSLLEPKKILRVGSLSDNILGHARLYQQVVLTDDGRANMLLYGSVLKVIREIDNPELVKAISTGIALGAEFYESCEEQEWLADKLGLAKNACQNAQKLLDRYLLHNCTELILYDGDPHTYLSVIKTDTGCVVSLQDAKTNNQEIVLSLEKAQLLFQLQTKFQEETLALAEQQRVFDNNYLKTNALGSKLGKTSSFTNNYFLKNPIPDCEIFAIAVDPKNDAPCILVIANVERVIDEIPKGLLKKLILKHLTGKEILSSEYQIALGVPETIKEIEEILSRL